MDSHVARSDAPDPTGSASPHTPVDILEVLPDAVFVVAQGAADGRILYANLQASRMFGYERGALIGQPIELLVPHRLLDRHIHHRHDYAEAPRLRAMSTGLTSFGCRRDGTEFPIDIELNSSSDGADPVTIAIVRDSTERTRALDGWLWHYNHHRKHSALGHKPPIARLHERTNVLGTYT